MTSFPSPGIANAITVGPDGAIWGTWFLDVFRHDPVTGAHASFPLRDAIDITLGTDGHLWIVQSAFIPQRESRLVRMTTSGVIASSRLFSPDLFLGDSTLGTDGAFWCLASAGASVTLLRVAVDGSYSRYALSHGGKLLASSDSLWVVNAGRASRIALTGVVEESYLFGSMDPFFGVIAAVDAAGSLWFAGPTEIARLQQGGTFTRYAVASLPTTPCGDATRSAMAFAPDGRLGIVERYDGPGAIAPPGDPCAASVPPTDFLLRLDIQSLVPASVTVLPQTGDAEVPALGVAQLIALMAMLALLGVLKLLRA